MSFCLSGALLPQLARRPRIVAISHLRTCYHVCCTSAQRPACIVQALPEHTPLPEEAITGVPFTASTEYDNQYRPQNSRAFNQIGTTNNFPPHATSTGRTHKLPMVTTDTTNQHDYPYWGTGSPQKKGYAVRAIRPAPPLDFAGDTFTTTNAVEYQPKPLSYVPPTGMLLPCASAG